jgi:hypothetical protein
VGDLERLERAQRLERDREDERAFEDSLRDTETPRLERERGLELDLLVEPHGSVTLIRVLTEEGQAWVDENVAVEGWAWVGDAFACEPRMVGAVARGAVEDGLRVG